MCSEKCVKEGRNGGGGNEKKKHSNDWQKEDSVVGEVKKIKVVCNCAEQDGHYSMQVEDGGCVCNEFSFLRQSDFLFYTNSFGITMMRITVY